MNIVQGFMSIPSLSNNGQGVTALFGELSTYSHTFSRNKSNYADPVNYPGVEFIGFNTVNDANAYIQLTDNVSQHILAVGDWVFAQHTSSSIPSNSSVNVFITALATQFPAMSNISINEIVSGVPATKRMPDYIAWEYTDSGTLHQIKVWFMDSRFRAPQYTGYEILVVPPISNIDLLNGSLATVSALLANVSPLDTQNAVNTLINFVPPTVQLPFNVVWHDPTNPNIYRDTTWTAIIYGAAGQTTDAIKDAIRNYISTHSALTVWDEIYPTLFSENEFVIIPFWNDVAVPEDGLNVGIYNGSVKSSKVKTVVNALIPTSYASAVNISAFMDVNLYSGCSFWRSISFAILGNPNNVSNDYNFRTKYPDYMVMDPSSSDFARMAQTTQDFITALIGGLEKAMTLTQLGPVPVGYTRAIRDGRVFLTFSYGGFNYHILTKGSYSE